MTSSPTAANDAINNPTNVAGPVQRIRNQQDLRDWEASEAYARILNYIKRLNTCAANRRLSDPCDTSEVGTTQTCIINNQY
jgi:hypothetical protein